MIADISQWLVHGILFAKFAGPAEALNLLKGPIKWAQTIIL